MRLALLAFSVLAAASTYAQQDPVVSCIRALVPFKSTMAWATAGDDKFAPISQKLAIAQSSATTFAMLADQSFATSEEQKAISNWMTARAECVRSGNDWRDRNYPPQLHALALEAENRLRALAVDLYNRRMSFGDFNKRRQAMVDEMLAKAAPLVQQLQAQQRASQVQQQAAQPPSLLESLGRGFQDAGAIMSPDVYNAQRGLPQSRSIEQRIIERTYTPPVETTCQTVGGIVRCTSK